MGAGARGGDAGARAHSLPRLDGEEVGRGAGKTLREPPALRPRPYHPCGVGYLQPALCFFGRLCSVSRLRLFLSFLNAFLTRLLGQRAGDALISVYLLLPFPTTLLLLITMESPGVWKVMLGPCWRAGAEGRGTPWVKSQPVPWDGTVRSSPE